ncbi:MAG: hypothetical protein JXR51_10845 [Bacteroidales bacterium]|nr:hypothetical protein [Bacteroidales bacterium]MBN2757665.1 hypothetical protein [Bacteroidales bacterium]
MKKILIISPNFPPNNTPDLHRIRIMLPHLLDFGWQIDILAVDSKYTEVNIDSFIEKTVPENINIYKVKALNVKYTRKIGLGNLGIRAFYFMYKKGIEIIKKNKPDIIFFSTTVFPVLTLGKLWKNKFKIPFVIDLQDPWRNDYYLNFPKNKRPKKFWFDYTLNKILEKYTIPETDGIISVTDAYTLELNNRYNLKNIPNLTMPLGASTNDFLFVEKENIPVSINYSSNYINIIYTGVIPNNMLFSIKAVLKAIKKYNEINEKKIKIYFIGSNYATKDKQKDKVTPIAKELNISDFIEEKTDRVSYFEAIKLMQISDILLLPGTTDKNYTASKLYPYLLSKKPILVVFNENSNLKTIITKISNLPIALFNEKTENNVLSDSVYLLLEKILSQDYTFEIADNELKKYTDNYMTKEIEELFLDVINNYDRKN